MRLLTAKAPTVRRLLNIYPPMRGAGIRVKEISDDFRFARVQLHESPWNRNVAGVHFGGSLFAMTDPFWMLLLMRHVGHDHIIWDKAAEIDFRRPGRGTVSAEFSLSTESITALRQRAAGGDKVLEWFSTEVRDEAGEVVATVRKQIYLRIKPDSRVRAGTI